MTRVLGVTHLDSLLRRDVQRDGDDWKDADVPAGTGARVEDKCSASRRQASHGLHLETLEFKSAQFSKLKYCYSAIQSTGWKCRS